MRPIHYKNSKSDLYFTKTRKSDSTPQKYTNSTSTTTKNTNPTQHYKNTQIRPLHYKKKHKPVSTLQRYTNATCTLKNTKSDLYTTKIHKSDSTPQKYTNSTSTTTKRYIPTRTATTIQEDSRCDRIHSSLTAVRCFDNGYLGKQPVALKEYCAGHWLKEFQESRDRCTGHRDITEMTINQSKSNALILSKTTNFKLFQAERVCRRQFQI